MEPAAVDSLFSPGVPLPQRAKPSSREPEADTFNTCSPADVRAISTAICQGDEAAFTRFYDLYSVRLYRHLLVLAKGNETDAREVLQTVVIKLARRFQVFEDERPMWSWLCRLCRNAYIDLCRVQRREQRFVPIDESGREHHASEPDEGDVRLSTGLAQALAGLNEEDQALIRSVYVDRRPLQEVADSAAQTYKAVESRLARVRQKLKSNLLRHLRHEPQ